MNHKLILVNLLDVVTLEGLVFTDFAKEIRNVFTDKHYMAISIITSGDTRIKPYADKLFLSYCFTFRDSFNRHQELVDPILFAKKIYEEFFRKKNDSYDYVLALTHYTDLETRKVLKYLGLKSKNFSCEKIEKVPYFFAEFDCLKEIS